jgi:hypothetical protein
VAEVKGTSSLTAAAGYWQIFIYFLEKIYEKSSYSIFLLKAVG